MPEKKAVAPQWWFGGAAAAIAACFTHPLDTIKVRLQTVTGNGSIATVIVDSFKKEGPFGLYGGLSASLLRQGTYSTARFAVYDGIKLKLQPDPKVPLTYSENILAGIVGGLIGGLCGTPADLVNVRMQNDGKLPVEKRRGYKNAFHGLYRIAKEEGPVALFRGMGPNLYRSMAMTASQVGSYDIFKNELLSTGYFVDNIYTHFTASLLAGLVATTVCSPFDVVKTRMMASSTGANKGMMGVTMHIFRTEGPLAFLKGWIPSYTRLGPHTILTFLAYEKIKEVYSHLAA
ncbi:mitochondrial carrier domain-containing protein [Polychytrium aggregatum]|uniref:mitochondrial carrier domain-containing protein n=1 Tax=Polychytrium aggregatum TaxID=110093 RepID=UPI0022FF0756|nr:mitochondrial carrier domain-containing protein [Polychytrium aggregatum]KAI9207303.1 mitochondrial carrier domain-containing protein [Polychytrium aggregatum]